MVQKRAATSILLKRRPDSCSIRYSSPNPYARKYFNPGCMSSESTSKGCKMKAYLSLSKYAVPYTGITARRER